MFSSVGAQPISLKSFRGLGHFPNKIAREYKREHCLPEWQAPVWVLTGFACYSARKSRLTYAGLLTCQECGNSFSPMIRCWNGKSRVEYVCRGYHRNGKSYCSSHRIHEEVLDEQVWALVSAVRDSRAEELKKLAQLQKIWALRKPVLDAHILSLQEKVQKLEMEVDEIVMEKMSCRS